MTLLEVEDLDAGYGDLQILDGVDMDVEAGEYVSIVGPNGAGKSTVMKTIFGLTTYMDGSIRFDDEEISGLDPEDIITRGLSYVPQTENVFGGLSVKENLEMGAYILDEVPQDRLEAVYERFPILKERSGQAAGSLSGGQRQMVAMGRALVEETLDRIDAINDSGTSVLIVEQNAKEVLRRCDRGYVLVQGGNRHEDTGEALLNDQEVREDFLGG